MWNIAELIIDDYIYIGELKHFKLQQSDNTDSSI